MIDMAITAKSPSASLESKELSAATYNISSMELSEDLQAFEQYNKEVDKLLGDESSDDVKNHSNQNNSDLSPNTSKYSDESESEHSPLIGMKIWDDKENKRDNSADFNKKFLRLSQKAKKKRNPIQGKFLKKLEKFKLEERSGAKSAEIEDEEEIEQNNNKSYTNSETGEKVKIRSTVSKKIQYLLNIEEFEKDKNHNFNNSPNNNNHTILSTLNETTGCENTSSDKSPKSLLNSKLNSRFSNNSYLNTPSTAIFSQVSPSNAGSTPLAGERRGSFMSSENNINTNNNSTLNFSSKMLSNTNSDKGYPSYIKTSFSNLKLTPTNSFNGNNYSYMSMSTSKNIISANNLNGINSHEKNLYSNMGMNMNTLNSSIFSSNNNNISPDYVNMRKFSYPVEPIYDCNNNQMTPEYCTNPNLKPFYNSKYPLKPQGTNLKGVFESLNPPESPEMLKQQGRKHLDDAVNRINLENILRGRDKRTTLMIRHIPNKYNLYTFLEDINIDFKGTYDVFYLPIDYKNNCNLGFAFINFVDPMHVLGFYDAFRGKRWRRFKSDKICELAYAKFQGKEELKTHFLNGSVIKLDSEDKKPVILSTPDPLPPVQIPLKFFDAFTSIYKFASCDILKNKFVVNSLYGF